MFVRKLAPLSRSCVRFRSLAQVASIGARIATPMQSRGHRAKERRMEVQGYASRTSVSPGDGIDFHLSADPAGPRSFLILAVRRRRRCVVRRGPSDVGAGHVSSVGRGLRLAVSAPVRGAGGFSDRPLQGQQRRANGAHLRRAGVESRTVVQDPAADQRQHAQRVQQGRRQEPVRRRDADQPRHPRVLRPARKSRTVRGRLHPVGRGAGTTARILHQHRHPRRERAAGPLQPAAQRRPRRGPGRRRCATGWRNSSAMAATSRS